MVNGSKTPDQNGVHDDRHYVLGESGAVRDGLAIGVGVTLIGLTQASNILWVRIGGLGLGGAFVAIGVYLLLSLLRFKVVGIVLDILLLLILSGVAWGMISEPSNGPSPTIPNYEIQSGFAKHPIYAFDYRPSPGSTARVAGEITNTGDVDLHGAKIRIKVPKNELNYLEGSLELTYPDNRKTSGSDQYILNQSDLSVLVIPSGESFSWAFDVKIDKEVEAGGSIDIDYVIDVDEFNEPSTYHMPHVVVQVEGDFDFITTTDSPWENQGD